VDLDQHAAGQAQHARLVGEDADQVGLPLDLLADRCSGLVDQMFFQWAKGKAPKAQMSTAAL
jgi:hypothetical protein